MFRIKNINMTEGPILSSVILYAIPIMLAGMLQIFFNAADLAVVGNFSGTDATAAVGATGSTISLIVNTVMGLSVGVNVMLARSLGAGERENSRRTVHTALAVAIVAGVLLGGIGILAARPAMIMTECPSDSLDMAVQYMILYFIGSPGILLYNFGSAILRTKGDTQRPLHFLVISGVVNVVLNLLFVAVFHMDAAGVGLATTISQYLAAFLTLRCLYLQEDETRFEPRLLHIHGRELLGIVKYGLPSGVSSAMFSISNLQIQTAINAYMKSAVAGNSASASLEGFAGAATNSLNAATVAFIGQNIGAGKRDRVKKAFFCCLILAVCVGQLLGGGMCLFGRPLLRIYLPNDPEAVEYGVIRNNFLLSVYGIAGGWAVLNGAIHAFGYSILLMINSIVGILGIRTIWMQFIYSQHKTIEMLYLCYPVTWTVILIDNSFVLLFAFRRYQKRGEIH